jgi:DNA-binding GntR family transcriptional regulator
MPEMNTGRVSADDAAADGQVALARDRLRSAIISGRLAAGAAISQPDLSELLRIGRTPLREAIRILHEEGLVQSQRNRRIRVADLWIDDLEDVYVLRLLIEAAGVRMTIDSLYPEQAAELDGLLAKMSHYIDRRDFERFEAPHRAFHQLLISGATPRMRRLAEQLSDHAERYRRVYLSQARVSAQTEHAELSEAAFRHDTDACARLLTAHHVRTFRAIAALLDPGHRPDRLESAETLATAGITEF